MNKVVWLARLLYNRKRMTLAEIREAWRDEDDHGLPMAVSTLYANRRKLEYTYHLDMTCHGGMYELVAGSAWLPLVSEAIDQ